MLILQESELDDLSGASDLKHSSSFVGSVGCELLDVAQANL